MSAIHAACSKAEDEVRPRFVKSTKSVEINCIEVARTLSGVLVRDSKHRAGLVLSFPHATFVEFLSGARSGEFDRSDHR